MKGLIDTFYRHIKAVFQLDNFLKKILRNLTDFRDLQALTGEFLKSVHFTETLLKLPNKCLVSNIWVSVNIIFG